MATSFTSRGFWRNGREKTVICKLVVRKLASFSVLKPTLVPSEAIVFCRVCQRNNELGTYSNKQTFWRGSVLAHRYYSTDSGNSEDSREKKSQLTTDLPKLDQKNQQTTDPPKPDPKGARRKYYQKLEPSQIDFNKKYYENTFISDTRAMSDYLLKPSDLEGLRTTNIRSAYTESDMPFDKFYLKSDVEARATRVWGSPEALAREIWLRRKAMDEDEKYRKGLAALIGHLKKSIKDHTKKSQDNIHFGGREQRATLLKGSARVVGYAIISNFAVMLCKFGAYVYTGSATMLSESIHSLADLLNQCLLAFGIMQSIKQPSHDHPYGWSRARYVYSLISGVGIFFLGAGVSVYHGVSTLLIGAELENLLVACAILGGSFVLEGATLLAAVTQVRKSANESGMSFREYLLRGRDPTAIAVLLEDGAAVTGVSLGAVCLGLTSYTGSPVFDAIGSLMIGGLLGTVAFFLIRRNADFLIGRSIPPERLRQIIEVLESDIVVRSIHDVKATELGADTVRFKAEVNFDGREISRCLLSRVDQEQMLAKLTTTAEMEQFMLEYGEQVIDVLGQQVDRIERNIKKKSPEVRHVDLEIL
ncbi:zinc transporter 9 isoform X2 [Nematostella vectensis]|uniref:zinc transporter 9 isoform X2 n=1 Tax=Nematostella vectensis TaxID=45351 RepID=UPI0013906B16|nr:zinc transporter 9 isoform X2 [Nematostella vectensis]